MIDSLRYSRDNGGYSLNVLSCLSLTPSRANTKKAVPGQMQKEGNSGNPSDDDSGAEGAGDDRNTTTQERDHIVGEKLAEVRTCSSLHP